MPVPPPTFPTPHTVRCQCHLQHPVRCQCHFRHSPHPILSDASATSNIPTSDPVSATSDIPHTPFCQMPVPPPTFLHRILSVPLPTFPTPHPVRCQCHLQHPILLVPLPTFRTPHPVRCQCHLQHSYIGSCQCHFRHSPHPILSGCCL